MSKNKTGVVISPEAVRFEMHNCFFIYQQGDGTWTLNGEPFATYAEVEHEIKRRRAAAREKSHEQS